jgi:dipeptidyl aminopeptidase/acylaminoacyl peptidase
LREKNISFYSDGIQLQGVLRYPDRVQDPVPGLLLIHGSLEHDRNGNLLRTKDYKKVYNKDFFVEISKRLCQAGFATFSWDRRGYGESLGTPNDGDYFTEVRDVKAALDAFCANSNRNIVDPQRVAVFGQSAGVYVASLLAKEQNRAGAYILSGGLYSDYQDMMSYNYHRVRDYANKSKSNLEWVEKHDLWGLVLGINLNKMFTAVENGGPIFKMEYKGHNWSIPIDKNVYSPDSEFAPKKQFKYIKAPTLIIHGGSDLNVPVRDAEKIEAELRSNGNNDLKVVIIPDADHSFQQIAIDEDTRLRERMSLESFKRPYQEEYFQSMIDFLKWRFNHEH